MSVLWSLPGKGYRDNKFGVDVHWTDFQPDVWRIRIAHWTVFVWREDQESRKDVLDRALQCVDYLRSLPGLQKYDERLMTSGDSLWHMYKSFAHLCGRGYCEGRAVDAWRKEAENCIHTVGYTVPRCLITPTAAQLGDPAFVRSMEVAELLTIASPINTASRAVRTEALTQLSKRGHKVRGEQHVI